MKKCLDCQTEKALTDFYHHAGKPLSFCKTCHNRRCHERRRNSPAYRVAQQACKKRWEARHPGRQTAYVKAHKEKLRTIFTHPATPPMLTELEGLMRNLWTMQA